MSNRLGFKAAHQLSRLAQVWYQREKGVSAGHVVISGDTGSGKTELGRYIDQIRLDRQAFVVVFVVKKTDATISRDYKGWTRWQKWKRNPSPHENRVLLWPDISKTRDTNEAKAIQREVFEDAIAGLWRSGKWTVDFDEGLYMCSPDYMNMSNDIGMLHSLGRTEGLTLITKMQRPANVPLIVYGSASHAFIGRTRNEADNKRLAELGGRSSARELSARISNLGRHDFLWVPVSEDWEPEVINLRK